MEFKEKLKQLIKTKYSRLVDLSEKFDMNYSQLSQYVNGKKISIEFLYKIIQEFPEADLNWLLRNNDIKNNLGEGVESYKTPLTKDQIIDKVESMIADYRSQKEDE